MENAMKSLPGAASILERQAMINNGVGRGGVRLGSLNVLLDMSVSSTKGNGPIMFFINDESITERDIFQNQKPL